MEQEYQETQQETKHFDPSKHLVQLKSKQGEQDYLPVKWRLVWFRAVHPHGTIDTEEMQVDIDKVVECEAYVWNAEKRRSEKVTKQAKGYARFRAIVTDGKGGRSTGTKAENAANFADFVEKSECVPLNSEILTRDGFKTYDQLTIGELVLAYDHKQDVCVWTPLQRVVVYENAPVSRLHGKCFDVLCTPNHSWATYSKTIWKDKAYEYRDLTKAYRLRKHHRIVLSATAPGGTHPLSPRDAAILGWLITDGSIQIRGNCARSYICQSKQENIPVIRELVGTLARETVRDVPARTFPSGRTYNCLPQHRFDFGAEETRRIFREAGISCIEDLPKMVTHYSSEARKAMLTAMMLADGDTRNYFGKKRKPGVMETWQILATLEGFALGEMKMSTVGEVPLQKMKKRRMVCASELQLDGVGAMDVWCPTTAYGTWVMRQNGRVMITGNTGAIGRALAAMGFGSQFTDEEFSEGERIVDAPVERRNNGYTPTNNTNGSRPSSENEADTNATEQQIASIRKLCTHLGKTEPENVSAISFLSAKKLLQQLTAEYKERQQNSRAS